jgi:GAF domain-containing protein
MAEKDEWAELSRVAREMSDASGVDETLSSAAHGALALIPAAQSVGVSVVHAHGRVDTVAATDDRARRGDHLQYELGEGPCLQSIGLEETVRSADLAADERWPGWSARVVAELGVRSMLCLQLFVSHSSMGALNLYSPEVDAFDDEDREVAQALAAHAAVALAAAKQFDSLRISATTRTVIGQAQGMLMQRYELTPAQSFDVLRRASQHSNRRLRSIAEDIVEHGIRTELLA